MVLQLLLLAPLCGQAPTSAPASDAASQPVDEVWVGHQEVLGTREIPVIGDLETRSQSYLLARATHTNDTIVLRQRACQFSFKKVLGVGVTMPPRTIARLPETTIRFRRQADGSYRAKPWKVQWGEEDMDRDGHPGATVIVDSALCSGEIRVATTTSSRAQARLVDGALEGEIEVRTQERILDASSRCLRLGSKDRDDTQQGRFKYRAAPSGTTCADLLRRAWPVKVSMPSEE